MPKQYEDVTYWTKNIQAFSVHAMPVLEQYVRYCRWFRGEMGDIERRLVGQLPRGARKTMVAMTNLVTRSSRAELFFRAPRFYCRPPGTLNTAVFTADLAHVETALLNHTVVEVGMYRQGRKMLLDGLLGPFMVGKVGYSADIAVDEELIERQREVAQSEDQKFVMANVRMKLKEDDLDFVHIEQHEQLLALAERGVQKMDRKSMQYLRKHIEMHRARMDKGGGRSKETIRKDSVFFRRISPLNFFYDPWHDNPEEREWVGERVIWNIEDVENNPEFDAKARKDISPVNAKWVAQHGLPPLPSDALMTPGRYTLLQEIIDLEHGKVIVLGHGCQTPLLVKDFKLQDILPSGPYVVASFMEDPIEDHGVPPPAIYEAHQIAASFIASVNTTAVKRSLPKLLYHADKINPQELEEIKRGQVGGLIPVRNLGPGEKISDFIEQTPVVQIPEQSQLMLGWNQRMCEQLSGLGSAKLAGGDTSRTATASSIISESTSNLSEDNAAVVDDMLQTSGRWLERLNRRFRTKYGVAEIVGDSALDHWPEEWAVRDIRNDRNVDIIPGSTRRNNAAVEQKFLQEAYALVAQDPQVPIGFRVELLQRLMESLGQFGLDFQSLKQGMEQSQLLQMLQGQMQGAGGQPGPGGPQEAPEGPAARPGRRVGSQEGQRSGSAQGANNVGGGRIPTGASRGDRPRLIRGGA